MLELADISWPAVACRIIWGTVRRLGMPTAKYSTKYKRRA